MANGQQDDTLKWVLIAGAVIAGGYIVYSMIQQDPEAKRALRDAKGDLKGAWNEAKGKANESYGEAKGRAKEATN
ncbi:hypothetical protein ABBQ38_007883 [Trebouxia sp. C0009 RCD-2024]